MYKVIKKNSKQVFDRKSINLINLQISTEINGIKNEMINGKSCLGAFLLENLYLLDGSKINAWVEYQFKLLEGELFNGGISQIIIYDGLMPDMVLDRYNEINKIINENKNNHGTK